ncbi:hypothetical protein KAJ87_03210 [Candidatus Pacearchaeota archaeon]|nr:hypothetical protein [Candidatus Pacearchaeota archaeon]
MTEKNYNPKQKEKKAMKKQGKVENKTMAPVKTEEKKSIETKKEEPAKKVEKKPVIKKTEAMVNGTGLAISTKVATSICRFIKGKKIEDAIAYLEQVQVQKKAIPMKGEIPHRKGKMMSGRYPKKASENFVKLLKNLLANSHVNGLERPIISEAIANLASRPFARFGKFRRKRTHVKIKARDKKSILKKKSRGKK